MAQELLVLDTHIWVWLLNGDAQRLSEEGLAAIEQASQFGQLGVSAISVWEVGMLEAKGRIRFAQLCIDWVREALSVPGLRLLPLTPEIAIESSHLPGQIQGDPADRILAATTRILDATLVTQDRQLLDYGAQSYISVIQG
ncbi:MAG: type II toxin-antitoxin system VapC family toxin [Aphanocapsa sp. GSE-SYN-MK-11-07L]|jgi:PIN domain nuclease of toxin-antitoxin system|nr:type II toxin-antitoxin system VapC family toxin [Aphanocapsa sp. GSE-SYN-MK-11-07L]